jgi:hypothetical protein
MATYRAAYIYTPGDNTAGTVLTLPEHAGLSDADLMKEAMAEVRSARLLDEDGQLLTDADICIGDWTD